MKLIIPFWSPDFLLFFFFFFSSPSLFSLHFRILGVFSRSIPSYQHAMTGVLENSKPTEGATADKNGTNVTFNEQTNYVPKSTIITVSRCGNKQMWPS